MDTLIIKIIKMLPILRKLGDEKILWIVQLIKFSVIGATNLIVSYIINIFTLYLLSDYQITYDYVIANMVAFLLSVLWSFYWNNRLVFNLQSKNVKTLFQALLKMYVAYGFTGIVLNNILSWFWIDILDLPKFIAPLINAIIGLPINFVLNKVWAFRE